MKCNLSFRKLYFISNQAIYFFYGDHKENYFLSSLNIKIIYKIHSMVKEAPKTSNPLLAEERPVKMWMDLVLHLLVLHLVVNKCYVEFGSMLGINHSYLRTPTLVEFRNFLMYESFPRDPEHA